MTGLTEADLMALLPHCAQGFMVSMPDRTRAGQPRTSRRYGTYDTWPLPTTADTRLFLLTYVQQHPIHAGQGQLCGMSPSPAHTWMPRLPPVLTQALAAQERLPARTADDVAARLMTPPTDASAPSALWFMMGPHDHSRGRKTRRSSPKIPAVRSKATRAHPSSCATRPVPCAS